MPRTPRGGATKRAAAAPSSSAPSTSTSAAGSAQLKAGLQVLTFNVKGEFNNDLPSRTRLLLGCLQRTDADIICLQELILPFQRAALSHLDYHLLPAAHWHPGLVVGLPLYANAPAFLIALIGLALWRLSVLGEVVVGVAALLVVVRCRKDLPTTYLSFFFLFNVL